MYLKRIDIAGFKSFAEPTSVELGPGLTAIVGPNGCGKSNIVDAIRWALGEQSARSLRGGAMADVIFNGGGRRGPTAMAEVTLRFDNTCRTLAVDRDEVRVTRRLFRSGESEYLLNGERCRLRDIRELLMDTGAGARSATFVEQGRIDALLDASPLERRQVLEEAAGIGKYKMRRKEALVRLEEVAGNRARLADVLREVAARHDKLRRQAKKAERYVRLREELRAVRLEIVRRRKQRLSERLAQAQAQLEQLAASAPELERRATEAEERAAQLAARRRELESAVRRQELELRDLQAAVLAHQQAAAEQARRAAECRDDLERDQRAVAALLQKRERLRAELQSGRAAAEKQRARDAGLLAELERAQAAEGALAERAAELEQRLEAARSAALEHMQAEARARNRAVELQARARVLAGREERLARKVEQTGDALAERRAQLQALAAEAEREAARAAACGDEARAAAQAREQAEAELRAAEERLLGLRRRHGELQARICALQALEREGAGLAAGVRAVLALDRPAILGVLADHLHVEQAHAAALSAALGPCAQWVLVRDEPAALELLEWLRTQKAGRCQLVVAAPLPAGGAATPAGEPAAPPPPGPGFVGWAAELARPDPVAAPLVARLLAATAVVRTLADARALLHAGGVRACATLAGELLTAEGGFAAGGTPEQDRLGQRSEREALERERLELEAVLEAARAELSQLRARIREADEAAARAQQAHQEAKLAAFSARRRVEEEERLLARVVEEERLGRAELAEVQAEQRRTAAESAALAAELETLAAAAQAREAEAGELAAAGRALELERAQARELVADLKVQLARKAEQWEALQRATARAERELAETEQALARAEADRARSAERLQTAEARRATHQAEHARLEQDAARCQSQLEADRTQLAALLQALAAARREQEQAQQQRAHNRAAAEGAERDRREAAERLDELAARARAELGLELEELPPLVPEPDAPAFNELQAEQRCAELRRQMDAIGAVNLEALEECEQLAQRRAFLTEQIRDLERAEDNLRATIRRINDTCRRRFLETWEAVRQHFRDIFRKLFGGGKADLVLEPDKDLLEAGVDVIARPPGKQARTISLLSGGEKTLTTVALLFAVFRARPGPFCVLDEVDAALDEHNVGRFVELVREFLDRSQILIVTHNKRTMVAADALYGVTMPEPGVSAPVSVRLADAERFAAPLAAAS
ncbi:MAG: hypothetical protein KatS3mg102_0802 [Planctomycetota bacterium]|nr:MAG: hypothetical protein KatS3mg102_0802 [Planctomycetota bacterium]